MKGRRVAAGTAGGNGRLLLIRSTFRSNRQRRCRADLPATDCRSPCTWAAINSPMPWFFAPREPTKKRNRSSCPGPMPPICQDKWQQGGLQSSFGSELGIVDLPLLRCAESRFRGREASELTDAAGEYLRT